MVTVSLFEVIVAILGTTLASSGFWLWVMKIGEKKDAKTKLLMGLASYRIMSSGMFYIERGWISKDEYEMMYDMLFLPYKELGGNGIAMKVICNLEKLPFNQTKDKLNKEMEKCDGTIK